MAEFDVSKKYLVDGSTLKRLADIVRYKIGKNVGMTLEQMGNYIYSITGDGSSIPSDGILITGDASYLLIDDAATAIVESAGDRIFTENLTDVSYMFSDCTNLVSFPFTLNAIVPLNASGVFKDCTSLVNVDENITGLQGKIKNMDSGFYRCEALQSVSGLSFDNSEAHNYKDLFSGCKKLKEVGYFENMKPNTLSGLFADCHYLREFPEVINFDGSVLHSTNLKGVTVNSMFYYCRSLRSIPEEWLREVYSGATTTYNYAHLYNMFSNCLVLDEIRGLSPITGTMRSNMFTYSFKGCTRIKNLIFATHADGTPYEVEWADQHIDLSSETSGYTVGWSASSPSTSGIVKYNSGITADKGVTNAETYEALKDDPDWFATTFLYSRYNHDSAVNTINSLPDTSAYLAAINDGATNNKSYNSITFLSNMGRDTDGGKIGNLTPEEIAVATAKGWTISLK